MHFWPQLSVTDVQVAEAGAAREDLADWPAATAARSAKRIAIRRIPRSMARAGHVYKWKLAAVAADDRPAPRDDAADRGPELRVGEAGPEARLPAELVEVEDVAVRRIAGPRTRAWVSERAGRVAAGDPAGDEPVDEAASGSVHVDRLDRERRPQRPDAQHRRTVSAVARVALRDQAAVRPRRDHRERGCDRCERRHSVPPRAREAAPTNRDEANAVRGVGSLDHPAVARVDPDVVHVPLGAREEQVAR